MERVISAFNTEQQDIINRATDGVVGLSNYRREDLIDHINNLIVISKDEALVEVLLDLKETVINMSKDDWEDELESIPYELAFSDNGEEPYGEDYGG